MPLTKVKINGFRNLSSVSWQPSPHINLITGANGSGKTSLLEALYVLGSGKSFRVAQVKPLVTFNADRFSLYGEALLPDRHSMGIEKRLAGDGTIVIDGSRAASASELASLLPIQHFGLDDFQLFEGGPRIRRRFLDWGVFHVEHEQDAQLFRRFDRAIKQRNSGLRSGKISRSEQQVWNAEFLKCAESLDEARRRYLTALMEAYRVLCLSYGDMPYAEALSIQYSPGWDQKMSLADAMQRPNLIERERKTGITQAGPHRADLRMMMEGMPARDLLSRGQMKVLGHLLKLAQIKVLVSERSAGRLPILLLDDLAAELDEGNVVKLLSLVRNFGTQVFLTTLDAKQLPPVRLWAEQTELKLFHVEHGQLTEQSFQE
ncbi:DNA replication/repair protein RecF [Salinispirillum sp. LH 10-3-1]|uniref:DNA replication and repair protein RecF n=1 Tax=Salinispirillum sp. LH 10-3-1 TaxID=2952525 RepID=A0AB38YFQ0_9GAMM